MTLIDVLDSAVKIGLGALITGFFTLKITSKQHFNSLQKDRVSREFELIQDIANDLENFNHSVLKFWAYTSDYHKKILSQNSHINVEKFNDSKTELFNTFSKLTKIESSLMLLGHADIQRMVRNFGEDVGKFHKSAIDIQSPLSENDFNKFREDFLTQRELIYKELRAVYLRL